MHKIPAILADFIDLITCLYSFNNLKERIRQKSC